MGMLISGEEGLKSPSTFLILILDLSFWNTQHVYLSTGISKPLSILSSPFVLFFLLSACVWEWYLLTHIWTGQRLFYQWKVSTCLWSYHPQQIKDSWHIIYALLKAEVFSWSRAATHSWPLFWSNDFLLIECSQSNSSSALCPFCFVLCKRPLYETRDPEKKYPKTRK